MKPELYFEMPDNVGVMLALINAVPAAWTRFGWMNGELRSLSGGAAALFDEAGYLADCEESLVEARRHAICFIRQGYRGWLQFVSGGYGIAQYKNPACFHMHLAPWIGSHGAEVGERPARIRLAWDEALGGCREDVASLESFCRRLSLREYEVIRASDWYRDWRADPLKGSLPPSLYSIAAE